MELNLPLTRLHYRIRRTSNRYIATLGIPPVSVARNCFSVFLSPVGVDCIPGGYFDVGLVNWGMIWGILGYGSKLKDKFWIIAGVGHQGSCMNI